MANILGILWKSPYRIDVTQAVNAGENSLDIRIVNLWPNRLIGDEELPEDTSRDRAGWTKEWPKWLLEGKRSPAGSTRSAVGSSGTKASPCWNLACWGQ